MAGVAIYDACVLHPAPLRDLLIRVARARLIRAHWTEAILDECFRSILKRRPDLDSTALERTRDLMTLAVPDCMVRDYEHLVRALTLPDLDDRHVLAAAIRCGAHVIVTFNLRDFPLHALAPYNVEPLHPDEFVLELFDRQPSTVARVVREQAGALGNPPQSAGQLLLTLERAGLLQSVSALRTVLEA